MLEDLNGGGSSLALGMIEALEQPAFAFDPVGRLCVANAAARRLCRLEPDTARQSPEEPREFERQLCCEPISRPWENALRCDDIGSPG